MSGFFTSFTRSFREIWNAPARPTKAPATSTPTETTQKSAPTPTARPPAPPKDQTHFSSTSTMRSASAAPICMPFSEQEHDLAHVSTAQEARQELRQMGFINGPEGQESINYSRLSSQSSETLKKLHTLFSRDNQTGRNNELILFGLRVAGSTLDKPAERESFINSTILNNKSAGAYMSQMSLMMKRKPSPVLESALSNNLSLANTKQTKDFLYQSGFLFADGMEENGTDIDKKALAHLPKPIIKQLIDNLSENGGFFNSNAPTINALKYLR
jgi:hypothetical protein